MLTAPDYIDQYLVDGTVECQWTEGSSLTRIMENDGRIEIYNKGNIVQVVPGIPLKYHLNEEHPKNLLN